MKNKIFDKITSIVIPTLLMIIVLFIIEFTIVSGNSMDTTLSDNQILMVQRMFVSYNHGDIVIVNIVKKTTNKRLSIVKRIIGMPGDTIEIKNNIVYLNNKVLKEHYIKEPMKTNDVSKITLKEDEYFLMGDNRNNSYDSRMQGVIKRNELKGKVLLNF